MGLYEKVIARLREETEKTGSVSELARRLNAQRATFHKVLRGDISTSAKTFCEWLERLGATVVFADEAPPAPRKALPCDQAVSPLTHNSKGATELSAENARLESALKTAALEHAKVQGMLCVLEQQNKEYQQLLFEERLVNYAARQRESDEHSANSMDKR